MPDLGVLVIVEVGYFNAEALPAPFVPWHRQPIRDALAGVGGSAAWLQPIARPFGPDVSRRDMYALRDQSGLPRADFFMHHFSADQAEAERREV